MHQDRFKRIGRLRQFHRRWMPSSLFEAEKRDKIPTLAFPFSIRPIRCTRVNYRWTNCRPSAVGDSLEQADREDSTATKSRQRRVSSIFQAAFGQALPKSGPSKGTDKSHFSDCDWHWPSNTTSPKTTRLLMQIQRRIPSMRALRRLGVCTVALERFESQRRTSTFLRSWQKSFKRSWPWTTTCPKPPSALEPLRRSW